KNNSRYYSAHYIAPLVAQLPKSSAGLIEETLATMPDSIVDEIMPHLQTLKAS
ncbi:MAG: hypothetical protein IT423_24240, partial [Pirellulaceae bacterium]|nr:hypothetical protein [Pirellulaceae bacterium]